MREKYTFGYLYPSLISCSHRYLIRMSTQASNYCSLRSAGLPDNEANLTIPSTAEVKARRLDTTVTPLPFEAYFKWLKILNLN